MESQLQDAVTGDKPGDYLRDPYPYFARKRSEGGVFHGTVMDYSKTPSRCDPSGPSRRCPSTR